MADKQIVNLDNLVNNIVTTNVNVIAVNDSIDTFTTSVVPAATASIVSTGVVSKTAITQHALDKTVAFDANSVVKIAEVQAVVDTVSTYTDIAVQKAAESATLAGYANDSAATAEAAKLVVAADALEVRINQLDVTNMTNEVAMNAADIALKVVALEGCEEHAATVEEYYEQYTAKYLGARAMVPSIGLNGNPIEVGATYWDTNTNNMYVWDGSVWGSYAEVTMIPEYEFTVDGSGDLVMTLTGYTEPGEYIEWSSV